MLKPLCEESVLTEKRSGVNENEREKKRKMYDLAFKFPLALPPPLLAPSNPVGHLVTRFRTFGFMSLYGLNVCAIPSNSRIE